MIDINSLEIFKQNRYVPTELGMLSDNAYLSIVVTNKCQFRCPYCINSETDMKSDLPVDKAIENIKKLEAKYGIKEAILLGGEPLLHPNILELIKRLRTETSMIIRLTTNGKKLVDTDNEFLTKLFDKDYGLHGINISYHNEDFISFNQLTATIQQIKIINRDIKIRINTNIWKGNHDILCSKLGGKEGFINFYSSLANFTLMDEVRVSNIIPKDDFSVNPKNISEGQELILSNEKYEELFTEIIDYYGNYVMGNYVMPIKNDKTLGFVKYILLPLPKPIIINWNIGSTVAEQICENDIPNRQINTFKCLVTGDISLSWNINNIIKL